jgi:hypothetical protein
MELCDHRVALFPVFAPEVGMSFTMMLCLDIMGTPLLAVNAG